MARRDNKSYPRRPEDWFPPVRSIDTPSSGDISLKADKVTQVIAGAGLTGGGDLFADRTFDIGAGTGITVNANDVAIDISAEAERVRDTIGAALVAGANITVTVDDPGNTITIAASGASYTDEQAQDAIGTILTDSSTIDFTYNDGAPSITASIVAGSVGPTELASTAVAAASYTRPSFTVDADGRLTAASSRSGTSFPGSPASGDVFLRTDEGIEYEYDGTRWLSIGYETIYARHLNAGITASANVTNISNPEWGLHDIYVLDFLACGQTSSAITWTNDLYKFDATTFTNIASNNTTGDAAGTYVNHRTTINAVVTSAHEGFQVNTTKGAGSATYNAGYVIRYRIVGT